MPLGFVERKQINTYSLPSHRAGNPHGTPLGFCTLRNLAGYPHGMPLGVVVRKRITILTTQ